MTVTIFNFWVGDAILFVDACEIETLVLNLQQRQRICNQIFPGKELTGLRQRSFALEAGRNFGPWRHDQVLVFIFRSWLNTFFQIVTIFLKWNLWKLDDVNCVFFFWRSSLRIDLQHVLMCAGFVFAFIKTWNESICPTFRDCVKESSTCVSPNIEHRFIVIAPKFETVITWWELLNFGSPLLGRVQKRPRFQVLPLRYLAMSVVKFGEGRSTNTWYTVIHVPYIKKKKKNTLFMMGCWQLTILLWH